MPGIIGKGGGVHNFFFCGGGGFPCNLKYLEGIFIGLGNLNLLIYMYYVKTKSHLKNNTFIINENSHKII